MPPEGTILPSTGWYQSSREHLAGALQRPWRRSDRFKDSEAIHRQDPLQNCEVLPLVGQGGAFQQAVQEGWLRRVGPPAALPSGGFSNQSLRGLLRDLQAGLPLLSWRQWRVLKRLTRQGRVLLAVGDLLPLLMACSSGARFGFVGTPKSDYTWRSGPGRNLSDAYHRF